jgi:hypothetical protein
MTTTQPFRCVLVSVLYYNILSITLLYSNLKGQRHSRGNFGSPPVTSSALQLPHLIEIQPQE